MSRIPETPRRPSLRQMVLGSSLCVFALIAALAGLTISGSVGIEDRLTELTREALPLRRHVQEESSALRGMAAALHEALHCRTRESLGEARRELRVCRTEFTTARAGIAEHEVTEDDAVATRRLLELCDRVPDRVAARLAAEREVRESGRATLEQLGRLEDGLGALVAKIEGLESGVGARLSQSAAGLSAGVSRLAALDGLSRAVHGLRRSCERTLRCRKPGDLEIAREEMLRALREVRGNSLLGSMDQGNAQARILACLQDIESHATRGLAGLRAEHGRRNEIERERVRRAAEELARERRAWQADRDSLARERAAGRALRVELAAVNGELARVRASAEQRRVQNESLTKRQQELATTLRSKDAELDEMSRRHAEASRALEIARAQGRRRAAELAGLLRTQIEFERRLHVLRGDRDRLREEGEALRASELELRARLRDSRAKLLEIEKRGEGLEQRLQESDASRQRLEAELRKVEEQLRRRRGHVRAPGRAPMRGVAREASFTIADEDLLAVELASLRPEQLAAHEEALFRFLDDRLRTLESGVASCVGGAFESLNRAGRGLNGSVREADWSAGALSHLGELLSCVGAVRAGAGDLLRARSGEALEREGARLVVCFARMREAWDGVASACRAVDAGFALQPGLGEFIDELDARLLGSEGLVQRRRTELGARSGVEALQREAVAAVAKSAARSRALAPLVERRRGESEERVRTGLLRLKSTVWIASAMAALFALVLGLLGLRWIVAPVRRATRAAAALARGDLRAQVAVAGPTETRALGRELAAATETMRSVLEQIRSSAASVHDTAQGLQQQSSGLSRVVRQQEEQGNRATGVLGDLTSARAEVADGSRAAELASQQAQELAGAGSGAMQAALAEMSELETEIDGIRELVRGLESSSSEIGSLTAAIGEIARQTNLLALNAAIEAKRAGVHGRSFGVVAGEVKSLAANTDGRTREISAVVAALQTRIGDSAARLDAGLQRAHAAGETAQVAERTLGEILATAHRNQEELKGIARSVKSLDDSVRGVEGDLQGILQSHDVCASAAREIESGSGWLGDVAAELRQLTERFRLDA